MKIAKECKKGNFSINLNPMCEHCSSDELEPFSPSWSDGYTWWCLNCADTMDDFKITSKFKKKLEEEVQRTKRDYFSNDVGVELKLVSCDDWQVIYINGVSHIQNHNVYHEFVDVIKEHKIFKSVQTYWFEDEEYMEAHGNFPDLFEKLPKKHLKENK